VISQVRGLRIGRQIKIMAIALHSGNTASTSHGALAPMEGVSAWSSRSPSNKFPASTAQPPAVASAP